jgi:hypothetical protein
VSTAMNEKRGCQGLKSLRENQKKTADLSTVLSSGVVCGRKAPKSICQQASPGSFDSAL